MGILLEILCRLSIKKYRRRGKEILRESNRCGIEVYKVLIILRILKIIINVKP
jgi:hypothetical protein